MTVKQLIDKLEEMPKDLPVVVIDYDRGSATDAVCVEGVFKCANAVVIS